MVEELTGESFTSKVLKCKKLVLVDFYAEWCGPCRMMSPVIDELSKEMKNVDFFKVNVDAQGELAQQFDVMSIPTLVLFKGGKAVATATGARPKDALKQWIKENE